MAKVFDLSIITASGVFFDGRATALTVKTLSGERGFLAGAGDIVCALAAGKIKFSRNGEWSAAEIGGGYLSVKGGGVCIISENAAWAAE
jgi:F0F1-type ATP synthase epsilon subunit